MEKDSINVQSVIDRLLWGKSIVKVGHHTFILRSLTIKEANLCQHIYDQELANAFDCGLMKSEELEQFYFDTGDWTPECDEKIESLKKEIKKLEGELARSEFMSKRKNVLSKQIRGKAQELEELSNTKLHLFSNSAENRAEEIRRRYMVMWSTETVDEKPYWATEEDFLNEDDHILIQQLALEYFRNNLFDQKTLRRVARSGAWRFRWKMAREGADLFGRPIADWSEMQNLIVYWSQFYDYVYENPDRPAQHVIDNDALCDAWVEEQDRKNSGGTSSGGSKNNYNMFGTKKAATNKTHQEQFIMVGKNDPSAIKQVQEMNAPITRKRLREEHRVLKEKGRISEFRLRKGVLPNGEKVPINEKR